VKVVKEFRNGISEICDKTTAPALVDLELDPQCRWYSERGIAAYMARAEATSDLLHANWSARQWPHEAGTGAG